jgi:HNH endonuclease
MRYKLHRIAPNSAGWRQPSAGRLGKKGVGEYVNEHGFGHEDWNFNFDLAVDGHMLGYTVANPAKKYIGENFCLILATYDSGGWRAAGCYSGAEYIEASEVELSQSWIDQMASDVFDLAGSGQAHSRYQRMSIDEIAKAIRKDFTYFNWRVPVENVRVFRQPLPIPQSLFDPGKQRMVTSYDLTETQFKAIAKIEPGLIANPSDHEEEEGGKTLRLHKKSERSAKLVAAFKASLETYACTVCGFEFESAYGPLGSAFIECHHTKPVSQMRPGDKTKVSDLCAVCSNCHRMLHRSNPMLTPSQLRKRLRRGAA